MPLIKEQGEIKSLLLLCRLLLVSRDSSTETKQRLDLRASHSYEEAAHKYTAHKATEESQH